MTPGMGGDKGEVHVSLAVYRLGNGHRETHRGLRSAVSSEDYKHITISFAFFFFPHMAGILTYVSVMFLWQ